MTQLRRAKAILFSAVPVALACQLLTAGAEEVRKAEPVDGGPLAVRETAGKVIPGPLVPAESAAPALEVQSAPAKPELKAGWQTIKEARTFTLNIPAPRGQITDRRGEPLAQCRVVRHLALKFPFLGDKAPDAQVLDFAAQRVASANRLLGKHWNLTQERVLQHYKNRRWLPLVFSITDGLNEEISEDQQARIQPLLKPGSGLVLQAAYQRVYPRGAFAPHIIGYTGKTRPLPLGPVQDGDVLFEEIEGREGLEKSFDRDLQGRAGVVNILFDPDGTKLKEEVLRRPVPGNNVVLTLDSGFQKAAEVALAKHTKGGAMVIMEVKTGEIFAMASYPQFDPNVFIPGVTSQMFARLSEDKSQPLYARAFQGEYPPASTFKIVVSLAALESGAITPKTLFDGPPSLQIGDHLFHNHTTSPEGEINVITAIKRSCNTWFYQVGIKTGASTITNMATRLGFGERSGIPLVERPGFVPTESWMQQHLGHKSFPGDTANLSIGQGRTLVTPLQAAQAMAALADGANMPAACLVKQVQDVNDRVIGAFPPKVARKVNLNPAARETVLKGMIAVVSGSGGTGHAAQLSEKYKCQIAGKTGTAQWKANPKKPDEDRSLAWFTGFLPADDPLYAFAVVYEGGPGQKVHGGTEAAPIVHDVFETILKNASPDEPLVLLAKNTRQHKAIAVTEADEEGAAAPKAESAPAEEMLPPPPPPAEKPRGFGGFFRKIFGR